MIAIFVRTILAYLSLLLIIRLMGKRQIGELQMTEFISAILLSELAALPIADRDIPLLHGIIPLCIISWFEVTLAVLCRKFRPIRHMLEGMPVELVRNGHYLQKNLSRTRISQEEIESQIRINGYRSIAEVDRVILEQTGKMSVLPTRAASGTGQQGNGSDPPSST